MKVGIVCTTHYSIKNNKYGRIEVEKFLNSLKYIKFNFELFLIDNQSTDKLKTIYEKEKWYNYYYIENQNIGGLTYAWNFGIKKAIDNNCDVILNCNDDLIFDNTINNFISFIYNHKFKHVGLYGPMTNKGGVSTPHQELKGILENKITETTNYYALNGFINGFSKEMFNKFSINRNLYSIKQEHKWGGQEVELFERNTKKGMRSFIYHNCFVKHKKHKSWLTAKNNENKK